MAHAGLTGHGEEQDFHLKRVGTHAGFGARSELS